MDEREDVINRIVMAALPFGLTDTEHFRFSLYTVLDNVEITSRTTEVAICDENKNEYWLKKFLVSKKVKGCTDRTIAYYKQEIEKALGEIGKSADEITADDIRFHIAIKISRDKVSDTTAGNIQRVLSSFFTYLQTEELILKNPMNKVERIKKAKIKKHAFTELEVEQMRAACITNKERAMLEFALSTWCRAHEIALVKIEDIKTDGSIDILGKGKKERTVYLNARAQVAVEAYLREREDDNPYLFPKMVSVAEIPTGFRGKYRSESYKHKECVTPDKPMEKDAANGYLKKIGKRAGANHPHAHKFRRTGATFALRRGMPIEKVSRLLGHEQIGTTQIYLDIDDSEYAYSHKKYVV